MFMGCRQVRVAERFRWVTTRGVDDGEILSGLPEDLQMAIKCHLCRQLLKEVDLFLPCFLISLKVSMFLPLYLK